MTIQQIVDEIKKRSTDHRPIMIAIEGFGGSGKSTFAAHLKEVLGDAYVVGIDDFIIKEKISDAIKSNFDRKRLERQVLLPIRNGQKASYQKLEWETNTLSKAVQIPDVTYLIIEGVSTFHPDIQGYFDHKIWIETPKDVAKTRGSKRDKELGTDNDHLWDHWTDTYTDYKEKYHPQQQADFIYNNQEIIE